MSTQEYCPPSPPPTPTPVRVRHMSTSGIRKPVKRISCINLKNIMEEYHEEVVDLLHDIETLCRKDFLERLKQD